MPTTAKLVSTLLFGVVLFGAAFNYAAAMPFGASRGWLLEVSAIIGAICGWWIMGGFLMRKRLLQESIGTGIRTALTAAAFVLASFAVYDALIRSMEHRYRDLNAFFLGVIDRVIALGAPALTLPVLGVLFFGGAVAGAIALWVARRWT